MHLLCVLLALEMVLWSLILIMQKGSSLHGCTSLRAALELALTPPVISSIAIHGNCKVSSDYLNNTSALSVIRFDRDAREDGIYSNSNAKTVLPAELSDCGLIDLECETEAITAEHFGVQGAVKAIILPQSVKSISDNAFEGWGLESIVIPASAERIGSNVFMDCKQLNSVVFEGIPKMFGCDIFDGCSSLESIVIGGQAPLLMNLQINMRQKHLLRSLNQKLSLYMRTSRKRIIPRMIRLSI